MILRAHARQQIHGKGQDVKRKHKRDNPLEHGGDVAMAGECGCRKNDCEHDFDQDERQFDPEGGAEDPVVAIVDSQPLVLGAQEDGGDNVTGDEDQ